MDEISLSPVCVRLGNEQVMVLVDPSGQPFSKWAIRVKDPVTGKFRKETRDEQLAFAAAPGTREERKTAFERAMKVFPPGGHVLRLSARRWKPGEKELVIAQLERGSADIDTLD